MAKSIDKSLPFEDLKIGPGRFKRPKFFSSQKEISFFRVLQKNIQNKRQSYRVFAGKKSYYRGQNSVVKASYLRNKYDPKHANHWAVHGRYLQRRGAQKEDEMGLGFNADRDDIKIAQELNNWQHLSVVKKSSFAGLEAIKGTILDPDSSNSIWMGLSDNTVCLKPGVHIDQETIQKLAGADYKQISAIIEQAQVGDPRMWKLIISPEAGDKVNLKEHAIKFMAEFEKDLGRKLHWVAIDHYNTANFHLHFCIRGVDKNGETFTIDKDYIKQGAREISKDLMTEQLGIRTDEFVLERRDKIIMAKHITELDRIIEMRLTSDHFINIDHGSNRSVDQQKRLQIMSRLEFLETLGLAKKDSSTSWWVDPTFLNYLKFVQEQSDIIKLLTKHKENITDPDLPLVVDKLPLVGDTIIGKVIGTGQNERNEDLRYIIVEGIDGHNHYLTANNKLMMLRDNRELASGDIVSLVRKEFNKEDKKISYIDVETYPNFDAVKMSTDFNNIDRYILEKVIKDRRIPEIRITDNEIKKNFLKAVHYRVTLFKNRAILDDNLEINIENFRAQYGRHL
jgi:hypothetical protein